MQVEQQFSHKFTVTVVGAESVTKGALGDLCEYKYTKFSSFMSCNKNVNLWRHGYFGKASNRNKGSIEICIQFTLPDKAKN